MLKKPKASISYIKLVFIILTDYNKINYKKKDKT